jgi:hypothetical protein
MKLQPSTSLSFACALPLAAALLVSPLSALAGKEERDFIASSLEPAVKTATAALKNACNASVKIDVKLDSFKTVDELRQPRHFLGKIEENAPKYCTDAGSKAAIGKLKTLEISRGTEVEVKFAGGKGTVTTGASSFPSWEQLTREVDK